MRSAVVVSYRLGGGDGVSVEAAKWAWALGELGYSVHTVAGAGQADDILPSLALDADTSPSEQEVDEVLAGYDLVVVENLCSLPLNPAAGRAVAAACRGRPTLLHHHDLPWQRPATRHLGGPPDDPSWRHVTINRLSQRQLADRGIDAVTLYNAFDPESARHAPPRAEARHRLDLPQDVFVVLQPTRALYRKNIPGGLNLAERLGASYWLLGPPEDGFGAQLSRILEDARCDVRRGPLAAPLGTELPPFASAAEVADAYAASDLVVLPSTWEGFGNPAIEASLRRRALAVGPFPVAREIERFGFQWFHLSRPTEIIRWRHGASEEILLHNEAVATSAFSLNELPKRLAALLEGL